jgi:protein arginine kinase activator
MRKCIFCKKAQEATSNVKILCEDKLTHELDMCKNCSESFLMDMEIVMSEMEMHGGGLTELITSPDQLYDLLQNQSEEPCPGCGQSASDVDYSNKLGCPECYQHYDQEIRDFFKEGQFSNKHTGKRPEKHKQLQELKLKLAHAKEQQKYVEAAELLNQIKRLEK